MSDAKRILYIRSGPYQLDIKHYNSQEIGLGVAFCKQGYEFDLLCYAKRSKNEILQIDSTKIRILWRHGLRLLRSGIYPSVFKRGFLSQYDAVIVSEYSQIMSVIVSVLHPNTYVYNGPYYNLFKIPFMEKIYDFLFTRLLNSHVKGFFCKTVRAKEFLLRKGLGRCNVVGVGLDIKKFDLHEQISAETAKLLNLMRGHRNILFVGSIVPRKNLAFAIQVFNKVKNEQANSDVQFIVIGSGNKAYDEQCKRMLTPDAKTSYLRYKAIPNTQLRFVYREADLFMLPSTLEIFGMVLLEAMFFGLPVIASDTAGAETLLSTEQIYGYLMNDFSVERWSEALTQLLDHRELREKIGQNAERRIQDEFSWEVIVSKMLSHMSIV